MIDIYWGLKSVIAGGMLWMFYHFLLKDERYFAWNRLYLLLSSGFILVLPGIQIPVATGPTPILYSFSQLPVHVIENPVEEIPWIINNSIGFSDVVRWIYFLGMLIFLGNFLLQLYRVLRIIYTAQNITVQKQCYLIHTGINEPFTFMHKIVLPSKDYLHKEAIIKHEKVHVTQFHSLDLFILEITQIALWFNPFIFLLKKSLVDTHEYLADQEVVKTENKILYQQLLLKGQAEKIYKGMIHKFSYVSLKKRLKMIATHTSEKKGKWAKYIVAPVLFVLLLSFGFIEKQPDHNIFISPNTPVEKGEYDHLIPSIYPIAKEDVKGISSGFGMRIHPISKKEMMHNGVDLRATQGTPVLATADGKIVKVHDYGKESSGKLILIQHADNYQTKYTQLNEFKVEEGQFVKQGEAIGTVGQSGLSTGPHLHYEVLKNGEPVDPEQFFN